MSLALWRDIAIVVLALQLFIILVFPLVLAYIGVRALSWVHGRLPGPLARGREAAHRLSRQAHRLSDQVARPVIELHARAVWVQTLLRRLR